MIGPAENTSTEEGWRKLEDKLRPFIAHRIHRNADVDDVLQEVFLRVLRGLPALRNEERFGPWVYQIARGVIIDHYRAAGRSPEFVSGFEREMSTEDDPADTTAGSVAEYARIILGLLPSPYREALTLTELEGLTQKEAAERLGISHSGMKSRVQRGRQKLRMELEECCKITLDVRQRVTECESRHSEVFSKCCK